MDFAVSQLLIVPTVLIRGVAVKFWHERDTSVASMFPEIVETDLQQ